MIMVLMVVGGSVSDGDNGAMMVITALPRSAPVNLESASPLALGAQLILGKAGTWNPDKGFWPLRLPSS